MTDDSTGMNQDKNDIALDRAPATVDNQKVLGVVQVSISDNAAEDGYKVLLANAETAVVPLDQFTAGAHVVTGAELQPVADTPTVQAVETPAPAENTNVAQLPEQPSFHQVDPAAPQNLDQNNGVTQ